MPRVPLAAVVDDPDAARRAFAAGIRCLKMKLSAGDPPERVRAIAAAAPGSRLRIDANRSWPPAEVRDRLAALAALPIEYVEEPCRDAHRLLTGPLPCRLALDESLVELSADDLAAALRSPALAAVILKPALLGGLSACLALAAQARASGVAAVASHALEGPIGTAACAELALALAAEDTPCRAAGLAPHPALAGWRLPVPQLAIDHVHPAAAPGLGFADLDLAGALRALEPAR
jgi:O-succinylbenzoate synthase